MKLIVSQSIIDRFSLVFMVVMLVPYYYYHILPLVPCYCMQVFLNTFQAGSLHLYLSCIACMECSRERTRAGALLYYISPTSCDEDSFNGFILFLLKWDIWSRNAKKIIPQRGWGWSFDIISLKKKKNEYIIKIVHPWKCQVLLFLRSRFCNPKNWIM